MRASVDPKASCSNVNQNQFSSSAARRESTKQCIESAQQPEIKSLMFALSVLSWCSRHHQPIECFGHDGVDVLHSNLNLA
jgi:hypothetical protein